jgi:hypothetical protein
MKKRQRSPNYPSFGLKDAIEKIRALHKAIGQHPTSRDVVATSMGYRGISGASATAISTLNKYGLLEGRGDEVRVSDRAMAILHPHSDDELRAALREAAVQPALFGELAEKFPGTIPNDDVLRNYLIGIKFTPQVVDGVISAYKETVEFVGGMEDGYDSAPSMMPKESAHMTAQPIASTLQHSGRAPKAHTHLPMVLARADDEKLNDISAEVFGGLVRVSALLDAKGLDKLERKIKALRALIADDDDESEGIPNDGHYP